MVPAASSCWRIVVKRRRVSQHCCWLDAFQSSATQNSDNTTSRRQHRLPAAGPIIGSSSIEHSSSARDLGVFIDSDLSIENHVKQTMSRAASARYDSCAVSGDRYRPLSSSHWSSRWSSAGLTTATLCWLSYLSTWYGVFSRFKCCSIADFWPSPF